MDNKELLLNRKIINKEELLGIFKNDPNFRGNERTRTEKIGELKRQKDITESSKRLDIQNELERFIGGQVPEHMVNEYYLCSSDKERQEFCEFIKYRYYDENGRHYKSCYGRFTEKWIQKLKELEDKDKSNMSEKEKYKLYSNLLPNYTWQNKNGGLIIKGRDKFECQPQYKEFINQVDTAVEIMKRILPPELFEQATRVPVKISEIAKSAYNAKNEENFDQSCDNIELGLQASVSVIIHECMHTIQWSQYFDNKGISQLSKDINDFMYGVTYNQPKKIIKKSEIEFCTKTINLNNASDKFKEWTDTEYAFKISKIEKGCTQTYERYTHTNELLSNLIGVMLCKDVSNVDGKIVDKNYVETKIEELLGKTLYGLNEIAKVPEFAAFILAFTHNELGK